MCSTARSDWWWCSDWKPRGRWVILRSGSDRWNDTTQHSTLRKPFAAHVQACKGEQVCLFASHLRIPKKTICAKLQSTAAIQERLNSAFKTSENHPSSAFPPLCILHTRLHPFFLLIGLSCSFPPTILRLPLPSSFLSFLSSLGVAVEGWGPCPCFPVLTLPRDWPLRVHHKGKPGIQPERSLLFSNSYINTHKAPAHCVCVWLFNKEPSHSRLGKSTVDGFIM